MKIIGLTGHSGSGKTTVASLLVSKGFYHIDCDKLVHEKVYTSKEVLSLLKEKFGEDIIDSDGNLNRRKLGSIIFNDKTAYNTLMSTVKPYIVNAIDSEAESHSEKPILLDAPTLFEFQMQGVCDKIIGVVSTKAVERICNRDNISETDAKLRLKNQQTIDFYRENCDYLIVNDYGFDSLEKSADMIATIILEGSED